MLRRQSLIAFLLLASAAARATEIQLSYQVLERLIAQQAFTDEGRRYVRGNKTDKCSFAYLENPKITPSNGKIAIAARFTGKSAMNMFGRCVGIGDAFQLTVYGVPFYNKGRVGFKDIAVQTDRDSYYIRKVKQALMQSLERSFDYNLLDDAKKLLEDGPNTGPGAVKRELMRFDVSNIVPANHALILTVDFTLAVK